MAARIIQGVLYLVIGIMVGYAMTGRQVMPRELTLRERAAVGDAFAQYSIGRSLVLDKNGSDETFEEGILYLQKAAAQGEVLAEAFLCVVWGVTSSKPYDHERALPLCERAAAKENARGMAGLANLLENNRGVDRETRIRNLHRARQLYAEAATKGSLVAMYKHGMNLYYGRYGDKSQETRNEGIVILEKSARAGFYQSALELADIYSHMAMNATNNNLPVEEKAAFQKADVWLTVAKKANSDKTEVFLQKKMRACIGSVAIYVPLSHTCQMAARAGIVEAQVALAKIYSYKPDSEENMQQALYWARAAAMQQDAEGQFLLADILAMQERQSGGTVDHVTERYAWYTIAAEKKELSLFKRLAAKNHAKKLWAEMTEGQREKAVALAQTYAAQSFMQAE